MHDIVDRLKGWATDWNGKPMVRGEPPRDGIHCDVLYDAIAELERIPCRWQPIETAPPMKSVLLFAVTDVGENGEVKNWKMGTGFWHTGYAEDERRTPWEWEGRQLAKYDVQPTHWQYLPEPPPCP